MFVGGCGVTDKTHLASFYGVAGLKELGAYWMLVLKKVKINDIYTWNPVKHPKVDALILEMALVTPMWSHF